MKKDTKLVGEQRICSGMMALSNLPVYMVHTRDGEGQSWTLHRNYLLPISNNLEQVEDENSVAGVEPLDKPTPVPPADNGLLANELTES